jgi:hypothetical protein
MENGGQKGPQRGIVREGTYIFNLAQFIVITNEKTYYLPLGSNDDYKTINKMAEILRERDAFKTIVIKGVDDKVGIVTVHDGPSLNKDDIIAPAVGDVSSESEKYHNNFQDPEKFLIAGGFRERQIAMEQIETYTMQQKAAEKEAILKSMQEEIE